MKITWINHAGFLVENDEIALVCDPWIEGTVFHHGWGLISKSKFTYKDFERVTHIWFSHEHPDHFNPPDLFKIDEVVRRNITVIFQTTADKKVKAFCEKLGFKKVIELPPSTWYSLGTDFKVINQNDRSGDSWLGIKTAGQTLLNMNDVVTYSTAKALNKIVALVGKVDILFTQFSYASWGGNKNNHEYRRKLAAEKLQILALQAAVFKPAFLVPFASFVWFCRTENYYHNKDANHIRSVVSFIEEHTQSAPIVLYPGDCWEPGEKKDNRISLTNYSEDIEAMLKTTDLVQTKSVKFEELSQSGKQFIAELKKHHNNFLLKLKLKKEAKIFLTDLNQACLLSLKGVHAINAEYDNCDIALTSESFAYCLKYNWGGDSLNVNGCFQAPRNGSIKRFQDYFYFSHLINMGVRYNSIKLIRNVSRKLLKL